MFCRVKSFASCRDTEALKRTLYSPDEAGENWLNECQISLSPCGSSMVCARRRRIVTLNAQWDAGGDASEFVETWNGSLPSEATALFAIRVHAEDSRESAADWICTVVGFKSGEVGFYAERGELLFRDAYDATPVTRIKCHGAPNGSDADELYLLYEDSVCCLAYSNLLQTLRYARLQLAKGKASFQRLPRDDPAVEGQNLLSRKLKFVKQDTICDASVIGLELSNTFDHLLTAAVDGGFYANYRSVAPHTTLVIGVGARPYVVFHGAVEGANVQPLLNDVARAVAGKIKAALPNWLGGFKSPVENVTNAPPPPSDRMFSRYSLFDLHRKGLAAVTSPDRRLLATIDTLGRVVIIDVRRGTAVRMFKGYRNCQCGFLQVHEETKRSRDPGRKALFIVLYVGKHGLLEVWPLRGPRIVAFSVAHNARLFYYTHNSHRNNKKRPNVTNNPVLVLMDPNGQLKNISVPFHFALNADDSERSRDVHIVKRIRSIVKEKDCLIDRVKDEVLNAAKEIKSPEIKIHCIEMMIANKNISPQILLECIQIFKSNNKEETSISPEILKINMMCENLFTLLLFFMYTNAIDCKELAGKEEKMDTSKSEKVETSGKTEPCLQTDNSLITESEFINLQHLLSFALSIEQKKNHNSKVTFMDAKKSLCTDFISCFNLTNDTNVLVLKEGLSEESLMFISKQIFNSYIVEKLEWNDVQHRVWSIKTISPNVLCRLLLIYWTSLPVQDINKSRMERFGRVMFEICQIAGMSNVYLGYGDTSPWWQSVRDFLVDSSCPFKSMVCAQICMAVAQQIEKSESKQNELDEDLWESVSKDNAQWGLLIGKFDDIALLSIVLSQKPDTSKKLPQLPIDLPEINLKYIFENGKGSISELVGIWLCTAGINLEVLFENNDSCLENLPEEGKQEKKLLSVQFDADEKSNSKIKTMSFNDRLTLLRKQFPFSLCNDNIIANMCWEYVKYWSINIEDLAFLDASFQCLKYISNISLKCGLCSMMWSTYLLFPFESASKLIGKVGKLPREKLTRQNVGLSDNQLLKFLEYITEFLDLFLCTILSSEDNKVRSLKFEDIWEDSKPALAELAVMKSTVEVDILQIHYQLSAALYYQCFLGSNFWKHPTNLFDIESQKCLFGPLSNLPGFHHQLTDGRVMIQRNLFLSRLVHRCADLPKDRDLWIERLQDLARVWRVNDDDIRREYVTRLYAQGLDNEAEEALVSITDFKSLLEKLIPIAGRRLKHFIDSCDNKAEVIAVLNPHVTNYLQMDEVSNELVNVTSLVSTRRLIEVVVAHGDEKKEYHAHKIANMLLDACVSIQEDLGLANV